MDSYLQNIIRFNEQLTHRGLQSERLASLAKLRPDAVVVCGMGGSALAGDIIQGIRDELGLSVPVIVHKDYGLPRISPSHKKPLYIFISFSGNTEETLSGLKQAIKGQRSKVKGQIGVITTDGELLRIARAKNLALISFPAGGLTPRQASGRMLYAISELLLAARLILRRPKEYTALKPVQMKRSGYALARRLKNKLIVIYSDERDRYLGYLWKIKFNETAKTPAFADTIPEMNHNELVGFEKKLFPAAALILEESTDTKQLKKRITINKKILAAHGVQPIKIPLTGKTRLERTWRTIMLADWTSYALAELRHIDPHETRIIDKLKTSLAK